MVQRREAGVVTREVGSATRAGTASTFEVGPARLIVHVRPVESGPFHLVTGRSSGAFRDTHLTGIGSDMCIGGDYPRAGKLLSCNSIPGGVVWCCLLRRSAARRGGTTSARSLGVRVSTTPSTVTAPGVGTDKAFPSLG